MPRPGTGVFTRTVQELTDRKPGEYRGRKDFRKTITYLRCARAHVILKVTPGTTIPNTIEWESMCWHERRTSARISKTAGGGISPGELRCIGTCNMIRINISSTRHLGHGRRVCGSGENDSRNFLPHIFFGKYENPLPHRRISKYDAGQEIQNGDLESSDVNTGEVLKLPAGDRGTGSGCGGRRGILQCRPPTDSNQRTERRKERLGRCVWIQTEGFSKRPQMYWQAPTQTRQKHRCLAERTRYYSFRYSTKCYGISGFLCARYNVSPLNLQSHCDGCGTAFGVTHSLSCSIGGLVIARHNKIQENLLYLSQCAFTPSSVRTKPLINKCRTRSEQETHQGSDKDKETWGDVMTPCKVYDDHFSWLGTNAQEGYTKSS